VTIRRSEAGERREITIYGLKESTLLLRFFVPSVTVQRSVISVGVSAAIQNPVLA
jgi:hypothetical protein